jgi:rod shape-determining protein MreC
MPPAARSTGMRENRRRLLRHLALGILLVASLGLLTGYYREGDAGPLHRIQLAVADIASPAEGVMRRASEPLRDLAGWVGDANDARDDRDRLAEENARLRDELARRTLGEEDAQELRALLGYVRSNTFRELDGYEARAGRVRARAAELYSAKVLIDVGSGAGVRVGDPVLGAVSGVEAAGLEGAALVGRVTAVAAGTSEVTLISDPSMAVGGKIVKRRGADGILQPSAADRSTQVMENVRKSTLVRPQDLVVTSGFADQSGELRSYYPRGIPIGAVTYVNQPDNALYKDIRVTPWVDLEAFTSVLVLTQPAGPGTQAEASTEQAP